ncbi:DegT/DnrJ/EryC1/StrS family aminotransferase [Synechococcus sp. CBW1107]|uniref:aminotransferase class I/II-fold pyridoxal phosphate-dependent enzyme n=1 Tax=Synechococcus sp. CBW1107 TaxID=2789857 RepID=UPI0018CF49C7|nr:aminotransferase class I/II-fold pyridoxal phosphate-dependent enzyme [Synechococcus sp. CBW1107]QPN56798.1 DegT/DnrJ/EryC1/StrS family aminotransferase [Synechococcus sp. CBW1107]CAK6696512.1 Arginine decarboxylase [Synechococcus sp. CBW1107]
MLLLSALRTPPPRLDLHLPAHGRGRGLAPALRRLLRRRPGRWDLPELPEIGGPLEPGGAVAADQAECARLCGADRCWFGVNGASGMLQVALLALARPGERVLLPRNLHRSLLHACVLGGLRPVLFDLPFDAATGLWLPPTPAWLQQRLAQAPPLAALVLVHPTYQGLAGDLQGLIDAAHRHGLPVLVDEAHGTHFSQPGLPMGAMAAGADLVVQSLHKSAGGLAQSAALLLRRGRVSEEAIERSLLWLQTSSPSALLLASAAAAIAHRHSPAGARGLRLALNRATRLRQALEAASLPLAANQDPLRLVFHAAALGINGLTADAWLLQRGVIAELPEPGCLTFCLGERPPRRALWLLPAQLRQLRQDLGGAPLPGFSSPPIPALMEPELTPGEAWRSPHQTLPLEQALERLAAEPICPYPPGIPLLIPGERIDGARLEWLREQRRLWPGQIADTVKVVA